MKLKNFKTAFAEDMAGQKWRWVEVRGWATPNFGAYRRNGPSSANRDFFCIVHLKCGWAMGTWDATVKQVKEALSLFEKKATKHLSNLETPDDAFLATKEQKNMKLAAKVRNFADKHIFEKGARL